MVVKCYQLVTLKTGSSSLQKWEGKEQKKGVGGGGGSGCVGVVYESIYNPYCHSDWYKQLQRCSGGNRSSCFNRLMMNKKCYKFGFLPFYDNLVFL